MSPIPDVKNVHHRKTTVASEKAIDDAGSPLNKYLLVLKGLRPIFKVCGPRHNLLMIS